MPEFHAQLEMLLADRRSPEARAFFGWLLGYVERRVTTVGRRFTPDLLHSSDLEEITSETLVQLIGGTLARFRGGSMGELVAYVRTVADRAVCHRVRRRLQERRTLQDRGAELAIEWVARLQDPDQAVRLVPDCPLPQADMDYLSALFVAGSKVEFARRNNVSRAAVTQRVQRIQARISALGPLERAATEAWMEQAARQALEATRTG